MDRDENEPEFVCKECGFTTTGRAVENRKIHGWHWNTHNRLVPNEGILFCPRCVDCALIIHIKPEVEG